MKQWILGGVSVTAILTSSAAGWSLTAQEAWDKWKAGTESYGMELKSGGEQTMDGKLTVSDVTFTYDVEDVFISGSIEQIEFAEQGDGSVAITMSESMPITISGEGEPGEKVDGRLDVIQAGLKMTAADSDEGTTFTYTADQTTVTIAELKVNGEDMPMSVNAVMKGFDGTYSIDNRSPAGIDSKFTTSGMDMSFDAMDPEGSGKMAMTLNLSDLSSWTKGQGMDMANMEDMSKMLADGFSTEGGAEYGAVDFKMDFEEDGTTVQAEGKLSGGSAEVEMNADKLRYGVTYEGLDVTVTGNQIPFPEVTAQAGQLTTLFDIPVAESDTASPFAMKLVLGDLEVGEQIWAMIDPGAVLPRDPATLILDVAGKARWMVDIFDEEAMMASAMPGQVESVDLNELKLSIGGAELTGTGGFTFDNSDLETFDGMPRPEGNVRLVLNGGNGLLDNLTKMGLVPEDQAMMARMMTGMLAKPGDGDQLISEIGIGADGQISANGAPLPF
ncbi:uncharacterized protein DUF2125 [Aliiruegeria haliotis]|uniref:Uncharacterized protein DUF2125 n=1 Tax=Aliiruegeria haliotis TaxID=1280846 RepID=A0A2T0RSZ9_9RHOB|nr:DUF2125 domain-containing protein [Aliiruegeria haliotis]PRY24213.1 uncharacterized protein DUF2125 [Aliiruegeria haliotis]